MIFNIDMGHSLEGAGTGANGIIKEVDLNRKVGKMLIEKLEKGGHTVHNCTVDYASSTNEQLKGIVDKSNSNHCDLFISLHANMGGGNGIECYICQGAAQSTYDKAEKITIDISNLGYRNRGVKTGNLYVLRNTKAPAILVELLFLDSKKDIDNLDIEKMTDALYLSLTGHIYNCDDGEKFYRVCVGSYKDVNNARKKAAEVGGFIVEYYKK